MKFNLTRAMVLVGLGLLGFSLAATIGCKSNRPPTSQPSPYAMNGPFNNRPGTAIKRSGDEIMVCGQLIHTGTRVVLWTDPGGYDAYRTERRFSPWDTADFEDTQKALPKIYEGPNRYGIRKSQIDDATFERIRGGGWDLPTLQTAVDQFVYHFDVTGTSRQCFNILQDHRSLSVHFMCDLDGTIYQTLDLKERAWHATTSNGRSIGIEIANIGAYGLHDPDNTLEQWYRKDANGQMRVVLPPYLSHNSGILTPNFVAHPIRNDPVVGEIQGKQYRMYDLTPQQYASLIKLTATLCTVFPKLNCDAPRDAAGNVIPHKLPDDQLKNYQGLLGHYHVQTDKQDPGPAFQWERIVCGAQALMTPQAKAANKRELGHPALPVNNSPTVAPSTAAKAAASATQPTTR